MVAFRHSSRPFWLRQVLAAALGSLALVCCGCQLAYFLQTDEEADVKAEYGKIGARKVAVIVWADRATIDEDPRVRQRICRAITYDLKKNLPKAEPVSADEVAALQERSGKDWENMSTRQLCERLHCDMILRIDLLEYTTRAGDASELRKGRVRATVNLHDGAPDAPRETVYQTEVVATYPPDAAHGVPDVDDADLLHETVEHFAEITARKFYDHKESLRGPNKH